MSRLRLVYVALNQFDPYLRDGGCRGMLDYLHFLQAHGHPVSILSVLCHDCAARLFSDDLADPGTPVVRDATTCRAVFRGLSFVEYRLPVSLPDRSQQVSTVRQHLWPALSGANADAVLTADEAYEPLFAAWWLEIPGCHFFHAPINVDRVARQPAYLPFLRTRTVFANSSFTQACIRDRLGLEAAVWYYPSAPTAPLATRLRTYTIGYSSSLGPIKGDAVVAELSQRLPHYRLIIVGNGYSRATPLPANVSYWGHIPDMEQFYRQIDLLIAPSLCEEAFPRVVVEALSRGIPVIANAVGGIPEALGESGILVECRLDPTPDPAVLADRYAVEIRRLFEDEALYAAHCQRAIAQAEAHRQTLVLQAEGIYRQYFAQAGGE